MNFAEVRNEVLRAVVRPDKILSANTAINKALQYSLLRGSFYQDLVETSLAINPTLYADTISLAALPNFRRFKYVKPTKVSYYLTPIGPEYVFTPQGRMQPNRYYLSGSSMTYTLSALTSQLEVGYYKYPPVLDETTNNTHWLLDACPYAIIDLAAAKLFAEIGDDASARRYEAEGIKMIDIFRADIAQGE